MRILGGFDSCDMGDGRCKVGLRYVQTSLPRRSQILEEAQIYL